MGSNHFINIVTEIIALLQPYLTLRHVSVEFDFTADSVFTWGSRAAYEAILTNLINNSLRAFARQSSPPDKEDIPGIRQIVFRTRRAGSRLFLTVEDNGPGIVGISIEDVWLPGKTTTEEGTGLGLTIVRDAVADLGGNITADAHGALGGARFNLEFPARD